MWKIRKGSRSDSGRKRGHSLRNILISLCLLLVLSSASFLVADPMDELSLILSDYVQTTNSLSTRFTGFEKNLNQASNVINLMGDRLSTLETNWMTQSESYKTQEQVSNLALEISTDSVKRIDVLESGYKSMERRLNWSTTINKILAGVVLALAGGLAWSIAVN